MPCFVHFGGAVVGTLANRCGAIGRRPRWGSVPCSVDRIVGLPPLAGIVLRWRGAADLPQPGRGGGADHTASLAVWRGLRPVLAAVAVIVVGLAVVPAGPPSGPVVSFLDVGQGDAALLRGPGGEVILIDGGPDPVLLRSHLRSAGVRRIDLLIVTHRHADHTTGLVGLHVPVGRVWHPPQLGEGPPFDALIAEQVARGAVVGVPPVGTVAAIGAFTIEVLGPLRRYASPNDGSLVVSVVAAGVGCSSVATSRRSPRPTSVRCPLPSSRCRIRELRLPTWIG
jgi:beta-lactamase superfamily II metal-dependent hydrolase